LGTSSNGKKKSGIRGKAMDAAAGVAALGMSMGGGPQQQQGFAPEQEQQSQQSALFGGAGPQVMQQMAGQPQGLDPLSAMLQALQHRLAEEQDGVDPREAINAEITPHSLGDAVFDSYKRLEQFRDIRTECIAQFAGPHYPDTGVEGEQYVNLLQQAMDTITPQIVSFEPRAHCEAMAGGLTVEAMVRELSLNRQAKRINLGDKHFEVVLEALFSPVGVIKTGLHAGQDQVVVGDRMFTRGEFYAEVIDFEDYVIDQSARRLDDPIFEGHRMRVPRSVALAAEREPGVPLFDPEVIKSAPRLQMGRINATQADKLAGFQGDPYQLVDMIELWEIAVYMGDRTMIYTLTDLGGNSKWARDPYEFWGPESGPYLKLYFTGVRSNSMPLSYASRILDLHNAGVETSSRFIEGIKNTKLQHIYRPGEEDLADAMMNGGDNEWFKGDPTSVADVKSGGLIAELEPGMEVIMQLFNNASVSSQLIGGQADISKTATAATILQGNAQARLTIMKERALKILSKVFEHMAWYQDNDPYLDETLVARLPGGVRVELKNTPDLREGKFTDFVFSVEAYAAKPMDPAVKLDKLIQALQLLPLLMQLGPQGMSKALQVLSKELQEPLLDEINPDPTMMMAREAVAASSGGPPRNDPGKKPTDSRPQPYGQVLGNARSANQSGQMAAQTGR